MRDTTALISALETAPGVIIPMIREVPPQILRRRPSPAKWSAYEHAIHLSQSDASFRARLDLILSTPEPFIKTIENSPDFLLPQPCSGVCDADRNTRIRIVD